MHILVLPSWFENAQNPTLGSFFKDQAIALSSLKHKVGIVHPQAVSLKKLTQWRFPKYYKNSGIPILTHCYFSIPLFRQYNISNRVRHFAKLVKIYINKHGKPDIFHAHSCALGPAGSAGIAAKLLSDKYNIPFVITEHGSAYKTHHYHPNDVPKMLAALNSCSALLAVSESLKTDLINFGVNRSIDVLGNIVDTNMFKPDLVTQAGTPPLYTFIVIAYLRPIKRIDLIINAFKKVNDENANTRLKIVGDGDQKDDLVTLVKSLKLEHAISFLGELPRQQVAKQMKLSSCYVLASTYETFAVVIHEALATGLAVISTKCGGPENIIRQLGETLLNTNDIDTLFQAMLTKSYQQQTNEQIVLKHQTIKAQYSQLKIAKQLEKTLISTLESLKSPSSLIKPRL